MSSNTPAGVLVALMLAAWTASPAWSTAAHPWKTYGNSRYGYTMCYPSDLFRAGAEPDAHDGITFKGPPRTLLVTSGGFVMNDSTPAGEVEAEAKAAAGAPTNITYRVSHRGWAVVSGTAGTKLFYARRAQSKGVMAGFEIFYPSSDAARYAKIVTRMNSCFSVAP